MSFEVLKNEKNVADVKLIISKEDFEAAVNKIYQKTKNKFRIDGFRQGKAPRFMIEQRYGKTVFYEDAIDEAFPAEFEKCLTETGFKSVATPVLLSIDEVGDDGAALTVQISLEPEFALPEYKGLKIGKLKYTPKKAEIEDAVKALRERNARLITLENEPSALGDIVSIDFEGFIDGVAFEGGKGESYPLELGSKSFIEGFEEQLVGLNIGNECDVNVTFPADYAATELAGKPAVFKVKINEIKRKELPELDDDFAVDLGYENLDALTKDAKDNIKKTKEASLKMEAETKLMEELVASADVDIPPQMVKEAAQTIKKQFEDRIMAQTGIQADLYYKYMLETGENKDPEQFDKSFEEQAKKEIVSTSILSKIIAAEELKATEEEIAAEFEKFAKTYRSTVEELKEQAGDYLNELAQRTILTNKAYDFLVENAVTEK